MTSSAVTPDGTSVISIVQTILTDGRTFDLNPRDIALLVLMRHEMEIGDESTLTLPYSAIQALHSRLDNLENKDGLGAEGRLSGSLGRLTKAECIARADMLRLGISANTEYQISPVGDSIAEWHVKQSKFSGEPLTAIFRSFISQLAKISEDAEKIVSEEEWNVDVVQQMQHALKETLVSIQRHQKELDRQHATLRQFVPNLLTQNNETSIGQCETQLSLVIETIDDLQEVVLASTSTAHSLIDRIVEVSKRTKANAPKGVELICDELTRRLQNISQWTTQRAIDWVDHHNVVHNFLRTIVRIDRQRRVTDALKHAVARDPGWTLEIAAEPYFFRMRNDVIRDATTKKSPRISKESSAREREYDEITPDKLPGLLLQYIAEDLAMGEARASSLMSKASNETGALADLIQHFPWLIGVMADHGKIDDRLREWTNVAAGIEIEELRIIP